MFKVEAGIPIPPAKHEGEPTRGDTRHYIYPFEHMRVGDSFIVPWDGEDREAVSNRTNNATCRSHSGTGKAYTTRRLEDGIRVWRTK